MNLLILFAFDVAIAGVNIDGLKLKDIKLFSETTDDIPQYYFGVFSYFIVIAFLLLVKAYRSYQNLDFKIIYHGFNQVNV